MAIGCIGLLYFDNASYNNNTSNKSNDYRVATCSIDRISLIVQGERCADKKGRFRKYVGVWRMCMLHLAGDLWPGFS
jgi:hypothetical protein